VNEKRAKKLLQCIADNNPVELAIGFLRYEALRKLNPREFTVIHQKNTQGAFFDDLVDEMIEKE